ncbi:MAG: metallophosphoesterase [Janthinobacterium lividum]
MSSLTRREFLRSAGGVTFLALVPIGRGLFAAPGETLPNFTALPYVQPGNSSRLIDGHEAVVIAWQTELTPAEFQLDFGPTKAYGKTAQISRAERWQGSTDADKRYNYAADLTGLHLSKEYHYRLRGNNKIIAEGYFTTRKKRGEQTRFVAFGDNSYGDPGQRAVAYHAYQAHPDIIVNTGDNVYEHGLDSEYAKYFYPIYNADTPDPKVGAPLLRSVPFYTVMANHDVSSKDAHRHPSANFDQHRDSLAYYTAMHLPLNGPATPPSPTPVLGDPSLIADFQKSAGTRFPRMANYSFDHGDAHFLCLDSNDYIDPTSPALHAYIEADLKATDALWKFVVYHHPAFNVGAEHYTEQHMRAISPFLEAHNVDFCLNGHEHVYQRSMPMRFQPTDLSKATPSHVSARLIPGVFTLDKAFDGKTHTKPNGVIYITTGAGGKELYDPGFDDHPELWLHPEDNNVAYVSRFVSNLHSFTVFDIHGSTLVMTQIGEDGKELDRIEVTKA